MDEPLQREKQGEPMQEAVAEWEAWWQRRPRDWRREQLRRVK